MASNVSVSINANVGDALAKIEVLKASIRDAERTISASARTVARTGDAFAFEKITAGVPRLQSLKTELASLISFLEGAGRSFDQFNTAATRPRGAATSGIRQLIGGIPTGAALPAPDETGTVNTSAISLYNAEINKLRAQFNPLVASEQLFARSVVEANNALAFGETTARQYAATVDRLRTLLGASASTASAATRRYYGIEAPEQGGPTRGEIAGNPQRLAQTAYREQRRQDVESVFGVGGERDRIRSEYDQIFRIGQDYRKRFDELRSARSSGAIGADVYDRQFAALKTSTAEQVANFRKLEQAGTGVGESFVSSLTRAHGPVAQLSFQINDIITQLSSGTPLSQTLMQQSGQILQIAQIQGKELLNTLGQMARVTLAPVFTPIGLAVTSVGLLAAAFTKLAYEVAQAEKQIANLHNTAVLQGRPASVVTTNAQAMQRQMMQQGGIGRQEAQTAATTIQQLPNIASAARQTLSQNFEALSRVQFGGDAEKTAEALRNAFSSTGQMKAFVEENGLLTGNLKAQFDAAVEAKDAFGASELAAKGLQDRLAGVNTVLKEVRDSYGWLATHDIFGRPHAPDETSFQLELAKRLQTPLGESIRFPEGSQQLPETVRQGVQTAEDVTPEQRERNALQREYNNLLRGQADIQGMLNTLPQGSPQRSELTDIQARAQAAMENLRARDMPHGAAEERAHASRMAQLETELAAAEHAAEHDITQYQRVVDARRRFEEEITQYHKAAINDQNAATREQSAEEKRAAQQTLESRREGARRTIEQNIFETSTLPRAQDPLNLPLQLREAQRELERLKAGAAEFPDLFPQDRINQQRLEIVRLTQDLARFNAERGLFQTAALPAAQRPNDPYAQLRSAQQTLAVRQANIGVFGQPAVEQAQLEVIARQKQVRDYELEVNQARLQGREALAQARGDMAAIVELRRQELALIEANPDKTEAQRLQARTALLQAQINSLRQGTQLLQQYTEAMNSFASQRLQTVSSALGLQAEIGNIRPSQAISAESALSRQTMAQQEARLEQLRNTVMSNPTSTVEERARVNQELGQLYEQDAQKQIEIQSRLTQAIRAENERRIENVRNFFQTIESGAASAFAGVVTGQKRAADALKELRTSIVSSLITNVEGMLSKAAGRGIANAMGIKMKEGEDTSISNVLAKAVGSAFGLTEPEPKTDQASIANKMQQAGDAQKQAADLMLQAAQQFRAAAGSAPLNGGRNPDLGSPVGTPSPEAIRSGGGVAPTTSTLPTSEQAVPRVYETDNAIGSTASLSGATLPKTTGGDLSGKARDALGDLDRKTEQMLAQGQRPPGYPSTLLPASATEVERPTTVTTTPTGERQYTAPIPAPTQVIPLDTQTSTAMTQLATAATQAQTSITEIGQSATNAGTSLQDFGGSAAIVGPNLEQASSGATTMGTSLTQAGQQAQQAGQEFAQAGQSAQSGAPGYTGGGPTSGGDYSGGSVASSSSSSSFLGGIGQIASLGTSLSALMGIRNGGFMSKIMAGISAISSITRMFSSGGLFGSLFSGLGGMFGGGGSLFGGAAGAMGGGGMFGGGLFSGIGSLFSGLFSLFALERGGIIPSAAGGTIVEQSLPSMVKSGLRNLAGAGRPAALAGMLAAAPIIPLHDGGLGVNDGRGGRLIVGHPNEMVVPAPETRMLLSAIQSGGSIPSAAGGMILSAANNNWRLPSSGPAPIASRITDSRSSIFSRVDQGIQAIASRNDGIAGRGDSFNINISAVDAHSVRRLVMEHSDVFTQALARQRRNFDSRGR